MGGRISPCCSAIHSRSQRPRVRFAAGRNQASNCRARLGSTVAVIFSSGISRTPAPGFGRRPIASSTCRREHSRQPRRRRVMRGWRRAAPGGRGKGGWGAIFEIPGGVILTGGAGGGGAPPREFPGGGRGGGAGGGG